MAHSDPLDVVAGEVFDAARKTGFALMFANYSERDAWEIPGGKIRGLEAPARDIASALRDSIWARFDSLTFHRRLITNLRMARRGETPNELIDANKIWSQTWHAHYLFDDLVFNAASLFDYVGNAIWFGFHGIQHVNKNWKKVHSAARRPEVEAALPKRPMICGSRTGAEVRRLNDEFVSKLYGYRSELIHNRMDTPDVYSHDFWEVNQRHGARLALPRKFAKRLKRLLAETDESAPAADMIDGAERLISKIGQETVHVLQCLRDDLGWDEREPLTIIG